MAPRCPSLRAATGSSSRAAVLRGLHPGSAADPRRGGRVPSSPRARAAPAATLGKSFRDRAAPHPPAIVGGRRGAGRPPAAEPRAAFAQRPRHSLELGPQAGTQPSPCKVPSPCTVSSRSSVPNRGSVASSSKLPSPERDGQTRSHRLWRAESTLVAMTRS
ncbi:microtubule cross-linking factor 1-like isoform X2 [Nannospalax galili]|uniref:microtubule cross-linking factor 1-like isoform X2 n=1 Tax=Nannospalax galili TaxID=1026970 RepID=UPI00111C6AE5|nr:microtubule cross-linking factor 1-like isoform X2 [Nannospalax galili]